MANCTRVKQRQEVTCWPGPKSAVITGRSGSPTSTSARPAARRTTSSISCARTTCDTLYLVGDIIDGWQLKKGWYWPQAHNDVVQKVLRKARKGTKVIYIPGNHDEHAAPVHRPRSSAASPSREDAIHVTADGKRLWIVHGDLFDGVMQHARWLALPRRPLYVLLLKLNRWFNAIRQRLGLPYWSMSQYLKHQVKNAVNFISDFEHVMTEEARRRGCDGVVCGHIHKAEIREIDGILYCNDGDWVESLTALVETPDGEVAAHRLARPPGRAAQPGTHRRRAAHDRRSRRLNITLVTDAWEPQVNGVVRTLKNTARNCSAWDTRWRCSRRWSSARCPARPIRTSGCRCCPAAQAHAPTRRVRSRRHPHRDRRPARARGARDSP